MNWSSEKPSDPGLYLFDGWHCGFKSSRAPYGVDVFKSHDGTLLGEVTQGGGKSPLDKFDGEWLGPITPDQLLSSERDAYNQGLLAAADVHFGAEDLSRLEGNYRDGYADGWNTAVTRYESKIRIHPHGGGHVQLSLSSPDDDGISVFLTPGEVRSLSRQLNRIMGEGGDLSSEPVPAPWREAVEAVNVECNKWLLKSMDTARKTDPRYLAGYGQAHKDAIYALKAHAAKGSSVDAS